MRTVEDMGFPPDDVIALRDFVESWDSHDGPLLFVGSGMSRFETEPKPGVPSGVQLADWNTLIATLPENLASMDPSVDGTAKQSHLGTAQAYADKQGRRRLIDRIEQEVPYKNFVPGAAYDALVEITWGAAVTTNYDDFLERTWERRGRPYTKLVRDTDINRARPGQTLEIIKLHGELEQPDTVVLSTDDYKTYSETRELLQSHVRVLLSRHPVLFIGFSLTDPNVTAMMDWVGARMGAMRLPSIALVHDEVDSDQSRKWAARHVHLARLPSGRTVQEFFGVLYSMWRPRPTPTQTEDSTISLLRQALNNRDSGWVGRSANLVAEIARSQDRASLHDAAHRVLFGAVHALAQSDISSILELVPAAERRTFLLAARRSGISEGRGKEGGPINVESALLGDDGLADVARAEVLVLRAEGSEKGDSSANVRRDLVEASRLLKNAAPSADARMRLRRVLLRLGDEELLAAETQAPLNGVDPYALARRGADLLMTQGREVALPWYERAYEAAKDADEKTVALLGIQACNMPGRWQDLSDLDRYWPSIRDGDRPKIHAIADLQKSAASELLRRYREGGKSGGNEDRAIESLERALVDADDMGLPRSPSPNFTGEVDSIAYALAGLLLREDAPGNDLLRGVGTFIERGLLQVHSRLSIETTRRVLTAAPTEQLRGVLAPRAEALFMRRSRALMASALLPVLPDEMIATHTANVLRADELEDKKIYATSSTESHLELLRRHYHAMPQEAARRVVRLIATILSNDRLAWHRHSSFSSLPIHDWSKTGVVERDDPDLQALVTAIASGLADDRFATDSLAMRRVLHLLDECEHAGAISEPTRHQIVASLDDLVCRGIEEGRESWEVFSFVLARHDLVPMNASDQLKEFFVAGYAKLRNSTAAGTWMNLVGVVGKHLGPADRAAVASAIEDYTNLTLHSDHRHLGPFPDWPATAIHEAANACILTPERAWQVMLKLTEKFPECIVRAIGMAGANLDEARHALLRAFRQGHANHHALLRWCASIPRETSPMLDLEQTLLGQLHSTDGEGRQNAYWSLGWLAESDALSPESLSHLRKAVLEFGTRDRDWQARGGAVVAAAKAKGAFSESELDDIQNLAAQDQFSGVRRACGLLSIRRR